MHLKHFNRSLHVCALRLLSRNIRDLSQGAGCEAQGADGITQKMAPPRHSCREGSHRLSQHSRRQETCGALHPHELQSVRGSYCEHIQKRRTLSCALTRGSETSSITGF